MREGARDFMVAGAGYDECYTQADAFWIDLNL
jgi:hypothetical protein